MNEIRIEIQKRKWGQQVQYFLLAIAPNRAILARIMIGVTLSREETIEKIKDFTTRWAADVYQPLSSEKNLVEKCEEFLL